MNPLVKCLLAVFFIGFFPCAALAEVQLGEVPPRVELKDKVGGRLDGTPWSSEELRDKVHVLFYVDPDKKDLNEEASEALSKENFPSDKFQSVAIINMAATWLPNFAISSSLEEKQKRYPRTIYVRDYKKIVIQAWGISDDESDILAFDKTGRLVFRKDGKLTEEEIHRLIRLIQENL